MGKEIIASFSFSMSCGLKWLKTMRSNLFPPPDFQDVATISYCVTFTDFTSRSMHKMIQACFCIRLLAIVVECAFLKQPEICWSCKKIY